MAISPYIASIRSRIGSDLLLVPTVAVLPRDEAGRILLVRQKDTGRWATVGGTVEPGESPADAARREAAEEADVEVRLTGLVGAIGGPEYRITYPNGDEVACVPVVYAAEVVSGTAAPDGDETIEVGWFHPDDLDDVDLDDFNGHLLRAVVPMLAPVAGGAASRPGWLLDELATVGRENVDAAHVACYDSKEDAAAASEVEWLRHLGLGAESVVVDLGAGTGQFAMAAAEAFGRVVAVDVSPVMLRALREKVRSGGLGNVEVVGAGFLTYDHVGEPADLVYSRYALHHLPDLWKGVALARIRRILRPGGLLRLWDVVYDFEPPEAEARIEAWCATGGTDPEAEWSRAELEEHVRDEASTFTWVLEPMIRRCGFEIEEAVRSEDGIFARYLARAV